MLLGLLAALLIYLGYAQPWATKDEWFWAVALGLCLAGGGIFVGMGNAPSVDAMWGTAADMALPGGVLGFLVGGLIDLSKRSRSNNKVAAPQAPKSSPSQTVAYSTNDAKQTPPVDDPYAILGLSPEAEPEAITAAYEALMCKHQLDTARAKKIIEAYAILENAEQRASYDLEAEQPTRKADAAPPPPPPPPPKPETYAGSESSSNLFVTSSGALRVRFILAFSWVVVALFSDSVHISRSDPLWVADALGEAFASFGIAYAVARLWKALSAQDVDQKTHRLRWFWLQALVLALFFYAQSMGTSTSSSTETAPISDEMKAAMDTVYEARVASQMARTFDPLAVRCPANRDWDRCYEVQTWPSGDRYEGYWANNAMDGYGVYISASGVRYEGRWKEGRRNGYVATVYSSEHESFGYYEDGKMLRIIR